MELLTAVTIGFGVLISGILFLILSVSWIRKDEVSHRLNEYVGANDGRPSQLEATLQVRRKEIEGTFLERTILPFMRRIVRAFGNLLPTQRLAKLDHKLQIVGYPFGFRAREFAGLQFVFVMIGIAGAYLIIRTEIDYAILLGGLIGFLSIMVPMAWLNRGVRNQQNEIIKELPNVIDMLSICTSAGLGFDQSLQRVSQEWQTRLSKEIGRVVTEMEMGLSRRAALRNLADRLEVQELSSFVSIIIQSDQLGMSISDTLHSVAEQMRIEWRFKAQEHARKLPVKILIPIVFFIFPAMLAVILGPSIPSLIGLMDTIN